MSGANILSETSNQIAFITLNRPAALNALTLGMVLELGALLRRHAADPEIRAVLLRGAGGKAFCAGGDLRSLYQGFTESGTLNRDFFVAEYSLDYALHTYPKPYIALLDGITMGGGMGLAQGSRLRIVGERSRIAMPEVGIGLFPDVGGSYFLSRLPGSLGLYLALTGIPLCGIDAVYAGLADVYLAPHALASLVDDLGDLKWSGAWEADVRAAIHGRSAPGLPHAPLAGLQSVVDHHFSQPSVPGILASLDLEERDEYAGWAQRTAQLMRSRSPTMMSVALGQLQRGRLLSLADCLRMELGMVEQCVDQGDFMEGVRALIVDKDNSPHWNPATLQEVTERSVSAFFRNRWSAAAHPLAHLERAALPL